MGHNAVLLLAIPIATGLICRLALSLFLLKNNHVLPGWRFYRLHEPELE